ncbi:Uncharacterised protein [Yersinia enterocolitica]|nr:Uncharacterised protein [Yersinia enterocolitica]
MIDFIKLKNIMSSGLSFMIVVLIGFLGYILRGEITIQTISESLKMICFYVILFLPLLLCFVYKKITYRRRMYSESVSLGIFFVTFAMVSFMVLA